MRAVSLAALGRGSSSSRACASLSGGVAGCAGDRGRLTGSRRSRATEVASLGRHHRCDAGRWRHSLGVDAPVRSLPGRRFVLGSRLDRPVGLGRAFRSRVHRPLGRGQQWVSSLGGRARASTRSLRGVTAAGRGPRTASQGLCCARCRLRWARRLCLVAGLVVRARRFVRASCTSAIGPGRLVVSHGCDARATTSLRFASAGPAAPVAFTVGGPMRTGRVSSSAASARPARRAARFGVVTAGCAGEEGVSPAVGLRAVTCCVGASDGLGRSPDLAWSGGWARCLPCGLATG